MAQDRPLVSVIVPNYNYGRTIGLCLEAIQVQTYHPVEVLVVDDCSTDDSARIARSLGVRVIRTPRNSGVAAARNLGAAHAGGQILVFVDSDVAMRPDAVANAVALLESDPAIGAVAGNYDPEPLIRDSLVEEYRNFHQYYWLARAEGRIHDFVPTAILAMRTDVFADVGGFDPRLRETEGAEYGRRLCRRYEIRLTSAVRGRHDNDATLRVVLRKVFHRTRLHIPFFVQRDHVGRVATTPQSGGSLAALLTVLAAPLPVLFGPVWTVPGALALLALLACDATMYRFAVRHRGPAFGLFFVAMHFLVNVTIAAGILAGGAQWLASPAFRRLYDTQPRPAEVTP